MTELQKKDATEPKLFHLKYEPLKDFIKKTLNWENKARPKADDALKMEFLKLVRDTSM